MAKKKDTERVLRCENTRLEAEVIALRVENARMTPLWEAATGFFSDGLTGATEHLRNSARFIGADWGADWPITARYLTGLADALDKKP